MNDDKLDPYEAFEAWLANWLAAHPQEQRSVGELARTEYDDYCKRLEAGHES